MFAPVYCHVLCTFTLGLNLVESTLYNFLAFENKHSQHRKSTLYQHCMDTLKIQDVNFVRNLVLGVYL